jgi:hypothetical protein
MSGTVNSGGYLSQGSPVKGVWHDEHPVYHVACRSSVMLQSESDIEKLPALRQYTTSRFNVDGWVCQEQVLIDHNTGEIWQVTCGTGFSAGRISRWSLVPGSLVYHAEGWMSPFEGGRSWYISNGVPTFVPHPEITIPTTIDKLRKYCVNDHSFWHDDWGYVAPRSVTKLFVEVDDVDWETIAFMHLPYMDSLLGVYGPSLFRDALASFKTFNTSPIVELIDTFGGLTSLKELIPGSSLRDLFSRMKYLKKNTFCENGVWKEMTKHGIRKMSKARLAKLGISKQNLLRTLAASILEYNYGFKLPLATLKEALSANSTEAYARALQSYWNAKQKAALEKQVELSPVLRSRFQVSDRVRVSCSCHVDLAIDDMFMRTFAALYQSGVLMTFEGIWDLSPLSFGFDWLSKGVKNFANAIDANTVQQMLRIHRTILTAEDTVPVIFTLNGEQWPVEVKFYRRTIQRGGCSHIGMRIQDFMPGFQAKFTPEASSLIYLLNTN